MKQHLSIALLSCLLFACLFIGLSGFTSNRPEILTSHPAFINHHSAKDFGIVNFGFVKHQVDQKKPVLAYNYSSPKDEAKPDNKNFQLIHWQSMQYQNRF